MTEAYLWQLEWAPQLAALQAIETSTGKTPEALLRMPVYDNEIIWYLEAFDMLSSSRNIGTSSGFIPMTEIMAHANAFGIIDEFKTHCKVIMGLDQVYLQHHNKK